MPPLNITYKIQYLNKISGFWETMDEFGSERYDFAIRDLYNKYKSDNSRQLRLIQVKEELIDSLYPPSV